AGGVDRTGAGEGVIFRRGADGHGIGAQLAGEGDGGVAGVVEGDAVFVEELFNIAVPVLVCEVPGGRAAAGAAAPGQVQRIGPADVKQELGRLECERQGAPRVGAGGLNGAGPCARGVVHQYIRRAGVEDSAELVGLEDGRAVEGEHAVDVGEVVGPSGAVVQI